MYLRSNYPKYVLFYVDSAAVAAAFDFEGYMMARAIEVNEALDKAVPMAYPEVVHESIRYSLLAGGKRATGKDAGQTWIVVTAKEAR